MNKTETKRPDMIGNQHAKGNQYRRGVVLSEETKRKISESRKGKHTGKRSPELCEKLRLAALNRYKDPEERRKASERTKIQMASPEARLVLSKVGLANKGRKQTPEQKQKQILAQTGKKKSPHTMEARRRISDAKRGSKNWCYGGDFTKTRNQIRLMFECKLWRIEVLRRDKFKCTLCGKYGGELHADHKKPLWQIVMANKLDTEEKARGCEELWDVNNGRTLCAECHRKTDTFGFKGCTRELRTRMLNEMNQN